MTVQHDWIANLLFVISGIRKIREPQAPVMSLAMEVDVTPNADVQEFATKQR